MGEFDYMQKVPVGLNADVEFRPTKLLESNALYEGQWIKGTNIREGMGKKTWPDGSMYEGWWKNSVVDGRGRLIHAEGDVYEGDWLHDKAHG